VTTPPQLSVRDRVMLAQGFYFLFFGALASVVFVAEITVALAPHPTAVTFCMVSLMAMFVGAWRLRRVRALGAGWKWKTRGLLLLAALLVYLFPFLYAWRQLPRSLYFCCHGILFLGLFILMMTMLAVTSESLLRALGRRGLLWQMIVCVAATVLLQVLPFVIVAVRLVFAAWIEDDAVMWLQVFVSHLRPVMMTLWLLPFTLSLSLTWTAKDGAMDLLVEKKSDTPPIIAAENKPSS
jgi:hypothetical protein